MSRNSKLYATYYDRPHLHWQRLRVWYSRYRNLPLDGRLMVALIISLVISFVAVASMSIWRVQ